MPIHDLRHYIEKADAAINSENFDELMNFYSDDATLVVKPGLNAVGKEQIRKAFVAIAEYFNHSLVVEQGEMQIIEAGDTALVLAKTILSANQKTDSQFSMERYATYIFKRNMNGDWNCIIDNSYGTELLMTNNNPTLHLICGKVASGKSTLANKLSRSPKTILISEDEWLANLYPEQINNISDYVRCTGLFRNAISLHIKALLKSGLSVVLDFPANTVNTRKWMFELIKQSGSSHQLRHHTPHSLADDALRWKHLTQIGLLKLFARDVGKRHAVPERKYRLALEAPAFVYQQRIALQRIHHIEHVVAHLRKRVVSRHIAPISYQLDLFAACIAYRIQPPVLDLQHHDALLRMQCHEIWMPAQRSDWSVVPHLGVVFEAIF